MAVDSQSSDNTSGLTGFANTTLGRNLTLIFGAIIVVAIMGGVWFWSQQPDYRVLFANYVDRDGGAIVAALQQMNVPYKFAENGSAILVPSTVVHDARLKLAAQGLPKGGNVGFELLENQKLGVSQFHEQINFQRALEGELATSIQSISSVQAARVHLALPKTNVFVREQQKPTASVLINLYPGKYLDPQQVSAVVHLVSSSVPELPPENVAIIDQNGTLLSDVSKKNATLNLDPSQLKYVDDLQRGIVKRIESIISPIVGDKNIRAEATADVDFSHTEQAAETYKPNQKPNDPTVRSQQTNEALNGNGMTPSGVPGTLTNQPPAPATAPLTVPPLPGSNAPGAPPPVTTKKETTTNYEVDKTVKYTQQASGGIKRLSVAIVVNYKMAPDKAGKMVPRALTEEEKAQITQLAKEAMGFNKERGDTINLVNSAFAGMEKEVIVEQTIMQKVQAYFMTNWAEILKYVIGTIGIAYLYFGVLKPLIRKINLPAPVTVLTQQLSDNDNHEKAELPIPEKSYEQKRDLAIKIATEDPKVVANVVKAWVNNE